MENNFFARLENYTNSKYFAWVVAAIFFSAGLALIFIANGTCDDGDSIMHYQFARWAVVHHELFFDHWAKPFYVLVASPFAQFGIPGIKIFNLLVSSITVVITYNIASNLNIKHKGLVAVMMVMAPGLITHSLSGLTEPLFALVLSVSILLYLRNYIWHALVVVSFLPFVRSEGLIICGVFAFMLIIEKQWKLLPLLLLGHVVYSFAGYPIHGKLLWVFTRIPYAHLSSVYGKGPWSHFFVALLNLIGVPLYVFLVAGLLAGIFNVVKSGMSKIVLRKWILVYGCFLAYFTAHVIFWKFGIFNSFGLVRVLVAVLPIMAILQLEGLNAFADLFKTSLLQRWVLNVFTLAIIAFPFIPFNSSWHYQHDFCLNVSQLSDKQATDYIKENFKDYKKAQYYYDANYISILMDIDYFDTTTSRRVWEAYEHPPRGEAFLLWDNWYSAVDYKMGYDVPANNPRFKLVKKCTLYDKWKYEKTTALFTTN